MDQEFRINLEEVRENVARAEVITIHFPYFHETLLLDTRTNATEGPLASIRPAAASVDERIKDLRSLRPKLGRPASITYIPWPKFVSSLKESGVWQVIIERLTAVGGAALTAELQSIYERLRADEWTEYRAAVLGTGYKTIWERR